MYACHAIINYANFPKLLPQVNIFTHAKHKNSFTSISHLPVKLNIPRPNQTVYRYVFHEFLHANFPRSYFHIFIFRTWKRGESFKHIVQSTIQGFADCPIPVSTSFGHWNLNVQSIQNCLKIENEAKCYKLFINNFLANIPIKFGHLTV